MKDINIVITTLKATFILTTYVVPSTSLGNFYTLSIEFSLYYDLPAVSIVSLIKGEDSENLQRLISFRLP